MNAKMPELKGCFEAAGFTSVKTVLSSGNVVFDTPLKSLSEIEQRCEAAMQKQLKRTFYTIVRSVRGLEKMLQDDPFAKFPVPRDAKRVVSFLRQPRKPAPPLPAKLVNATIFAAHDADIFSAYVPGPEGPVFMKLIERTFGKDITTRTWDTVKKCAKA